MIHLPGRYGGHYGFNITIAEKGAWVLSDVNDYENRATHFACQDSDALYDEMRAWVEREIVAHRATVVDSELRERTESSGTHLAAARDVSA